MEVVTPVLEEYDNLAYLVTTLNYIKVIIIIHIFFIFSLRKAHLVAVPINLLQKLLSDDITLSIIIFLSLVPVGEVPVGVSASWGTLIWGVTYYRREDFSHPVRISYTLKGRFFIFS